jgi:hypothetical protein
MYFSILIGCFVVLNALSPNSLNKNKKSLVLHQAVTSSREPFKLSFPSISKWFQDMVTKFSSPDEQEILSIKINLNEKPPEKSPTTGVLIVGATGRVGKEISKRFCLSDRDTVISSRLPTSLFDAVGQLAVDTSKSNIFFKIGLDVTNPNTINEDIFKGVETLISCIGPSQSGNMNAENIDYKGNLALIESLKKYVKYQDKTIYKTIYNFDKIKRNLTQWVRLDDVIMGGKSSSSWSNIDWKGEGQSFARWSGSVITEGGGFCGTTCLDNDMVIDPKYYDGISIRVRGDGNRYKLRLRIKDFESNPIFQGPFDTVKNQWMDIKIPFEYFYNNKQTIVNYSPNSTIKAFGKQSYDIGFIFSKFDFNERLNSKFIKPEFSLDVENIQLYRDPRPAYVMISSAGTERINRLTPEERMKDIPIIRLNPLVRHPSIIHKQTFYSLLN